MQQSRRLLVLRAVVEDYIRSQEPVGSNAIARKHDLGVSSATVRNDMAALEDEGYLTQPHTSAGRVPTEKGYRYFVDQLATVVPLSEAQRRGIGEFLSGSANLQDTLQRAARLLAADYRSGCRDRLAVAVEIDVTPCGACAGFHERIACRGGHRYRQGRTAYLAGIGYAVVGRHRAFHRGVEYGMFRTVVRTGRAADAIVGERSSASSDSRH